MPVLYCGAPYAFVQTERYLSIGRMSFAWTSYSRTLLFAQFRKDLSDRSSITALVLVRLAATYEMTTIDLRITLAESEHESYGSLSASSFDAEKKWPLTP